MDEEPEAGVKLGVFSTGPSINAPVWNVIQEAMATAILLIGILAIGHQGAAIPAGVGPIVVGLLIALIGFSAGGGTGFAINPARDLGPRIAHAILPIKGKGDSNWGYAWIPVVGPILGGLVGTFVFDAFLGMIK